MAFNIPHSFIHPSMPCIINIYTLYKQMLCVCLYVQRAVAIYLVSCLVAAKVIVPWLYTVHVHQFSVRSFAPFCTYLSFALPSFPFSFFVLSPKIFSVTNNTNVHLVFLHFHSDFPFYVFQCARLLFFPFSYLGFLMFCMEVYLLRVWTRFGCFSHEAFVR